MTIYVIARSNRKSLQSLVIGIARIESLEGFMTGYTYLTEDVHNYYITPSIQPVVLCGINEHGP